MRTVTCSGLLVCLFCLFAACADVQTQSDETCDADSCNGTCVNGVCMMSDDPCAGVQCDDENPCTIDDCVDGDCRFVPVPNELAAECPLEGGQGPGICSDSACVDAELCEGVDCNDDDTCTADSCDPSTGGCRNEAVADDPETACNIAGLPEGVGVCTGGTCTDPMRCEGANCDDREDCTSDECDPFTGECRFSPVADETPCPDRPGQRFGLCMAGVCVDQMRCAGVDCDDGNECTSNVCDVETGDCRTANVPNDQGCDFGGLPGICQDGACESAMLCADVNCNDQNACTDDACRPEDGMCTNTAIGCDDGNACTTNDPCDPATGCSFTPIDCPQTDSDPCTVEACSGGNCVMSNAPNGTECTTLAIVGENCMSIGFGMEICIPILSQVTASCVQGVCIACDSNADCDDGNSCTVDTCSSFECSYRTDLSLPGCLIIIQPPIGIGR